MDVRLSEGLLPLYLARAVQEFDRNRQSARLILRLSEEAPELFLPAALSYLVSDEPSNATRFLVNTALKKKVVFEFLTSPEASKENAINLYRRFVEVEPSFDVKLAERLSSGVGPAGAEALDILHSARALDILDMESRGGRLLTVVGRLLTHQDSRISAKAALFVGRRLQNLGWIRTQLDQPDQRVRANAIQSLWGVNVPEAITLLEDYSHDMHHRVSGNSLLGLHLLGRKDVAQRVFELAGNGTPEFRAMAAWMMGRMRTPDCFARLAALVKDANSQVRSTALRSLLEVRRHSAKGNRPRATLASLPR